MVRLFPYVLFLLASLASCSEETPDLPRVIDGSINLEKQNFTYANPIPLDGTWEFYWNQLYMPADFLSGTVTQAKQWSMVPSSWTNQMDSTGNTYPMYGYATYRVKVLLPKKNLQLGLYVPKIWCANRVWVNDSLIYEAGTISTQLEGYENKIVEGIVEINTRGKDLDLVVQVANYDMFLGGLLQSFQIGQYSRLMEQLSMQYSWTLMWLGALFVMGFYHFILYLFRKRRKSTLYFGTICLLLGSRLIIFGDHFLYESLKNHAEWFSFAIQSKIYYTCSYALIPIGLLFLRALYPNVYFAIHERSTWKGFKRALNWLNKRVIIIALLLVGAYTIFILLTPPRVYIPTIPYFPSVFVVFILYMLAKLINAAVRREKDSSFQIVGISVMLIAGINDILHQVGWEIFGAFELIPIAFVIFLSLQFIILARRFSRAFREVEDLSENLEQKVKIRTAEVSQKNEEIQAQNDKLEKAYQHITDSVVYASRIQKAILGNPRDIVSNFKDAFIFLSPRDIVSGDFYWYAEVKSDKPQNAPPDWKCDLIKILIAADCTGHGVPGAFMTVMANDFLNEIILEAKIFNPEKILYELDKKVIATLKKQSVSSENQQVNDGMDITIIAINETKNQMIFAGAKNPLYFVRNGEMHEIKGSKFPIGGNSLKMDKVFESQPLVMQAGDTVYMCSDGFQDQFGQQTGRKYMKKRFRQFLHKISTLPMNEQKAKIQTEFETWKGEGLQTDDVLLVGVQI